MMQETETTPIPAGLATTPFTEFNIRAGGRMVDFAGFYMPVQFSGIVAEHQAVRQNVGLFDLSHMGEFEVTGADALPFLQRVTSNNVEALSVGKIQYSCLPNPQGGIVDDLLVYRLADRYFLVVNASNIDKDFAWLTSQLTGDVKLVNRSSELGLLAVQGPNAQRVLSAITSYDLDAMPYYSCAFTEIAGVNLLFSRTGYTGEDGFEIYVPNEYGDRLWDAVTEAGAKHEMQCIGLGARDTLRLEMKMALYGNDINDTTSPVEAGLSWIVDFEKDFVGKETILAHKLNKPKRRLICLELTDKGIPRHGFPIFSGDKQIGEVTSGTFSPSLQKPIALGYVATEHAKQGSTVEIDIRGRRFAATVVPPPFYKHGSHR